MIFFCQVIITKIMNQSKFKRRNYANLFFDQNAIDSRLNKNPIGH